MAQTKLTEKFEDVKSSKELLEETVKHLEESTKSSEETSEMDHQRVLQLENELEEKSGAIEQLKEKLQHLEPSIRGIRSGIARKMKCVSMSLERSCPPWAV